MGGLAKAIMNNFEIFQEKSIRILGHDKPSQDEAKEYELAFFWSGIECKNGHLDYRRIDNRTCCHCIRDKIKARPKRTTVKKDRIKTVRIKANTEEELQIERLKEARKKTEEILYHKALKELLGDLYDEDEVKYK